MHPLGYLSQWPESADLFAFTGLYRHIGGRLYAARKLFNLAVPTPFTPGGFANLTDFPAKGKDAECRQAKDMPRIAPEPHAPGDGVPRGTSRHFAEAAVLDAGCGNLTRRFLKKSRRWRNGRFPCRGLLTTNPGSTAGSDRRKKKGRAHGPGVTGKRRTLAAFRTRRPTDRL